MSRKLLIRSFALLGMLVVIIGCGERIPPDAERRALLSQTASVNNQRYNLTGTHTRSYSLDVLPENMTLAEKKERFAYLVAPVVEMVHTELMGEYLRAAKAINTGQNRELEVLKSYYQVTTDQELLRVLKPHPKSIAMAQAAMESAWGTSRFFRQANNIFGVWSFDRNEPRIAASELRGAQTVWVKKYVNLDASIRDYFRVLAKPGNFSEFQKLKMETDDPYLLVQKLDRYSEKGPDYGRELSAMIRYNDFQKYD